MTTPNFGRPSFQAHSATAVPGQHVSTPHAQQASHVQSTATEAAASTTVPPTESTTTTAAPSSLTAEQAATSGDITTPEQFHSSKMQIANSILTSLFKLKESTCEYDKKFLLSGISLNFEYLGRVELSKMQQDMAAASQAIAAAQTASAAAAPAASEATPTAAPATPAAT